MFKTDEDKLKSLKLRYKDLKQEREPYIKWYKDICKYISPFSGAFSIDRSYRYIFNDHASYCLDILVSGLASGSTSPLRPWFRLLPPNEELAKDKDVQRYFGQAQEVLNKIFQRSNTYNSLHVFYQELCLFGVAVDLIYDDLENVISHHVLTAGEYCIASNTKGEIDTVYREFELTVAQAVKFFDYDKLSDDIKQEYKNGKLEKKIKFIHAIEPRADRDLKSSLAVDMPYASYYFEEKGDKVLKESGFKHFPALVARWNVTGLNCYGTSPCTRALPDIKQLQYVVERLLKIVDRLASPPVQIPDNARTSPLNLSADGKNFLPSTNSDNSIKPIFGNDMGFQHLLTIKSDLEEKLNQKFYVSLFLMLQGAQNNRKTTIEVYGLQEEQRLILGQVTERLAKEVQQPLVKFTFYKCQEQGIFGELPQALEGYDFEVEIQSVFAQAQRAVDINAYDRFFSTVQSLSATQPEIIDRINIDGTVDEYAERLGVSYKILKTEKEAQEIRDARAQQQQAMAEAEQMQKMGATMQSLAQAQQSGANASLATQNLDPVEDLLM